MAGRCAAALTAHMHAAQKMPEPRAFCFDASRAAVASLNAFTMAMSPTTGGLTSSIGFLGGERLGAMPKMPSLFAGSLKPKS